MRFVILVNHYGVPGELIGPFNTDHEAQAWADNWHVENPNASVYVRVPISDGPWFEQYLAGNYP